jgi:DNA-binding MarR family transcriptional regulator
MGQNTMGNAALRLEALLAEAADLVRTTLAEQVPRPSRESATLARALYRERRERDRFLPGDYFSDPAWDILLELYASREEGRRISVTNLCEAAAVPTTTALRWIKMLTDDGLLVRVADRTDGRRVYVDLAPSTVERLSAYLMVVRQRRPAVQSPP